MIQIITYIKNNKFINILNISILLTLILPYSSVYMGGLSENNPLTWKPQYVYEYFELMILFIPIVILTIGFQLIKYNIWRKIVLGILVFTSGICTFLSFLSTVLPTQDFHPSWGLLLSMIIFPLSLIVWKIDQRDSRIINSQQS